MEVDEERAPRAGQLVPAARRKMLSSSCEELKVGQENDNEGSDGTLEVKGRIWCVEDCVCRRLV